MEKKKPVVAICVPRYGSLPALSTLRIDAVILKTKEYADVILCTKIKQPVDKCRNELTELALKHNPDYLLWLDSDQTFPSDLFLRMYMVNEPIVCGLYYSRFPPYAPVARLSSGEGHKFLWDWEKDEIINVSACGFGCALIQTKVFKELQPNDSKWFYFSDVSEDMNFFRDAEKLGYKVFLDTSIPVGHCGGEIIGFDRLVQMRKEFEIQRKNDIYPDKVKSVKNRGFFDPIKDLAEYYKITEDEALDKLNKGVSMFKEEWVKADPKTPDQEKQFYETNKNYVFDLMLWHAQPEKMKSDYTIALQLLEGNRKTFLDYGCGVGINGMIMAKHGFDVTFADVNQNLLDFCEWRCKKYNIKAKFVNLSKQKIKDKFDVIMCFDVLEHVNEPKQLLRELRKHLTKQGMIMTTLNFNKDDNHPMHHEISDKELKELRAILRGEDNENK